ncbi:hypothetical protein FLP41_03695 (plasmid) [Paracoccus marcusii]|uniref:hypothetical protein n=1 Tax=Paracoccus marcusii TaxID=59779 RepID=UPI002ED4E7A6|nr:hypothetical protein FLP41_03695 [Paracoccus marcusii]
MNEAQVQLNQAERQLARLSELGAGVVALAEIENAQSTRDVAQVAYEDALDSLNYATMQAPSTRSSRSDWRINMRQLRRANPSFEHMT